MNRIVLFAKKMLQFALKRWYVVIILAVIGGVYVYNQRSAQAKKEKENLYTVTRQDLKEVLSLSGEIDADEHVVLRFQTSGRLAWVGAKVGDTVKKYQGIASLDQRELKKNLQKSLNTYAKYRNTFDQSRSDNQRIGDQPQSDLGDKMKRLIENSQYDLNNSVIDVELDTISAEYAHLWTPINGLVIRADARFPGLNITPAGAEFEIVNPETVFFSFTADQTEVVKLRDGLEAEVIFDSYPDDSVKGTLYYISYIPKAGESGTVYEGKLKLTNTDLLKYRFGMTGDVSFVLREKKNVVVVPSNYIRSDAGGRYVQVMDNGRQKKTYVKEGIEVDGVTEILGGIEEQNIVVIPTSTP